MDVTAIFNSLSLRTGSRRQRQVLEGTMTKDVASMALRNATIRARGFPTAGEVLQHLVTYDAALVLLERRFTQDDAHVRATSYAVFLEEFWGDEARCARIAPHCGELLKRARGITSDAITQRYAAFNGYAKHPEHALADALLASDSRELQTEYRAWTSALHQWQHTTLDKTVTERYRSTMVEMRETELSGLPNEIFLPLKESLYWTGYTIHLLHEWRRGIADALIALDLPTEGLTEDALAADGQPYEGFFSFAQLVAQLSMPTHIRTCTMYTRLETDAHADLVAATQWASGERVPRYPLHNHPAYSPLLLLGHLAESRTSPWEVEALLRFFENLEVRPESDAECVVPRSDLMGANALYYCYPTDHGHTVCVAVGHPYAQQDHVVLVRGDLEATRAWLRAGKPVGNVPADADLRVWLKTLEQKPESAPRSVFEFLLGKDALHEHLALRAQAAAAYAATDALA